MTRDPRPKDGEHTGAGEQPLPVVLTRAWQRQDDIALETFSLQSARGHLFLSGQITSAAGDVPCFVNYGIVCTDEWVSREAHVHITRGGTSSLMRLARSDAGLWEVDGTPRADLDGAVDLDVQWTPATNALPINRLNLEIGESREVDAVWVRLPELRVERLPQKYSRLAAHLYRYESGGGSFVADLRVDDAGFVVQYGDIWTCVGRS